MDNPLPNLAVEQDRLDNGLTVLLLEDRTLPLVAVNVNYMVGSKNERPGRTGFAHLFEHMMFQGSKHHDDDYFTPLQDVGASVNGGTNTDRTRYWELLPSGYLERALWLESDRMGFLLDAMTEERLANQVSVVQNERRQNYENRPYGTVWEKILAVVYPPNHPYSWPTIGSMADLQAASLADVAEFFRTYYAPNNASLCIAGDFDPAAARGLVERYFAAIPPGPPVSHLERWGASLRGQVELVVEDRVQLARTYLVWPGVPVYSADDAALDVLAQILGGGKTSRLYRSLVYERQIAQDASLSNRSSQIAGVLQLVLTPRPGHQPVEVEGAALDVIAAALSEGVTPDEVTRAQTAIQASFVRGMQSLGGFGGLSDRVNEYYHYLGRPDMFRWDLQRYLDLTPAQVTAAGRRALGADRVRARVLPQGRLQASTATAATSVDRSRAPDRGPESAFTLPARQRFTLANGLEVVLVEKHELPLVSLVTVIRGGTSADPQGREGLASLTAALVQEGAGGRSAADLADAIESLGAELDVAATPDAVVASMSTLRSRLAEALALYADVIVRPDLPPAELERQRRRRLVRLQQLEDQPSYVARVACQRAIFHDHPYGRPDLGTPASVTAITHDDVAAYWMAHAVPGNSTLIAVGDVTRAELEESLQGGLAGWPEGPVRRVELPAPTPLAGRSVYLVDRPGAVQSVIQVGHVGAARSDAEYPALQVVNTVLGGQFVSRLNLNLREDRGYTYGVRSSFDFGLVPGTFTVSTSVHTEVTAQALAQILLELAGIAGPRPVDAVELAYAQRTLTNGYPRRFETGGQVARALVDQVLYRLPEDSLERFPTQVGSLALDEANAAARASIHPEALAIVIVGDRAAILEDLEALDLGPVVELGKRGEPAARRAGRR